MELLQSFFFFPNLKSDRCLFFPFLAHGRSLLVFSTTFNTPFYPPAFRTPILVSRSLSSILLFFFPDHGTPEKVREVSDPERAVPPLVLLEGVHWWSGRYKLSSFFLPMQL